MPAAAAGSAPVAGAAAVAPPAAPSPPTGGAVAAMGDEVPQWCSSLPIARVTRWGGMISTPDALLQVSFQFASAVSFGLNFTLDPFSDDDPDCLNGFRMPRSPRLRTDVECP